MRKSSKFSPRITSSRMMQRGLIIIASTLTLLYSACDQKPKGAAPSTAPSSSSTKPSENLFSIKDLRQWTKEVLKWDEASIAAAISKQDYRNLLNDNKIALKEFDVALKLFAEEMVRGPITQKEHWLNQNSPGENFFDVKNFGKWDPNAPEIEQPFYAKKVRFPKGSSIVVMGDFHGSVHSLIRNLWRLKVAGFIDDNFKILKDNVYFIFTGDFVDRGRYSVETLYTLIRLQLANVDKVFLLRGNHETKTVSEQYGLIDELLAKYGNETAYRLFKDIIDLYHFLPVVLFVEQDSDAGKKVFHFSHGGFTYDTQKKEILHSPEPLLADNKAPFFEQLPPPFYDGYMWGDFHQPSVSKVNAFRGFASPDMGVAIAGKDAVETYFQKFLSHQLVGIFRGHQDRGYGLKLLFKDSPDQAIWDNLTANNPIYPTGPFDWRDVIAPELQDSASTKGIQLTPYRPVFTFTTAAEGQAVPFDNYGIIKDAEGYRLEIHDVPLTERKLDRSYVTIAPALDAKDDGIHVTWAENGPGKLLIP